MARDLLIDDLTTINLKISLENIQSFLNMVDDNDLPPIFSVDVDEGIFKFDRIRKQLFLLKRFSYRNHYNSHKYKSDYEIDLTILRFMKTAKLSGYKIYFEQKFSN